jgi:hypothetical protein
MMRAWIALLAVLLPLAACGDDALSTAEYRERLDAACKELSTEFERLPQTVRDRDLTIEDAREIADSASKQFDDVVTDLDPPGELEDAHEALLDNGKSQPDADDRAAIRRWTLRFAEIYDDLGAHGCAERQRRAAAAIEG